MKHAYSNGYSNNGKAMADVVTALVGSPPHDNDALVEQCYRHLSEQSYVLWGRSRNIDDPRQRREAAVWLAEQIDAVAAV